MEVPRDPSDPGESAAFDVVHRLLVRFHEDGERGTALPLADYLALFPGFEREVRAEYGLWRASLAKRAEAPAVDGRCLGRFRLLREIGRGGHGVVYVAEDAALGRRVALKTLPDVDARARLRLEREAETLMKLRLPGVAQVYELGDHEGTPFLALQLVEGESLRGWLARAHVAREGGEPLPPLGGEPADERGLAGLIERVARTLHAVHEVGCVHRDLKPENILLRPDGTPMLIDFGLALDLRAQGRSTQPEVLRGSPLYMAPEQLEASRELDRRADVYALGVVLYECLALRPPFESTDVRLLRHGEKEPLDLSRQRPGLSRDLAAIVRTAMAREPDRRYQSALALAEDLACFRGFRPIRARPSGPLRRLARWGRRNPLLAGATLFLCAALLVALVSFALLLVSSRAALEATRLLADEGRVALLLRQASELGPILPRGVPGMTSWCVEVEPLLERLLARPPEDASSPSKASEVGELRARLEQVRRWLAQADEIGRRSIEGSREPWAQALSSIRADPHYGGLDLAPQAGLVPIGRDRESGLLEFGHLQTGKPAARDPGTCQLELEPETGLVFVLLPAGTFDMGAWHPMRPQARDAAQVDPQSGQSSEPVHAVALDPFFLSKYEMTQGQWLRLTGRNPSRWSPGSDAVGAITLLHPVENLSFSEAIAVVGRFGLDLPTEAQWEYGARAGTTTIWWTGNDKESLVGAANLADQAARRAGFEWPHLAEIPGFEDGHVEHSPVGIFRANPFGLHDVHGNVRELCLDSWGDYREPVRRGDGLRLVPARIHKVARGGGFYESANHARCASRYGIEADLRTFSLGLRPARRIEQP